MNRRAGPAGERGAGAGGGAAAGRCPARPAWLRAPSGRPAWPGTCPQTGRPPQASIDKRGWVTTSLVTSRARQTLWPLNSSCFFFLSPRPPVSPKGSPGSGRPRSFQEGALRVTPSLPAQLRPSFRIKRQGHGPAQVTGKRCILRQWLVAAIVSDSKASACSFFEGEGSRVFPCFDVNRGVEGGWLCVALFRGGSRARRGTGRGRRSSSLLVTCARPCSQRRQEAGPDQGSGRSPRTPRGDPPIPREGSHARNSLGRAICGGFAAGCCVCEAQACCA